MILTILLGPIQIVFLGKYIGGSSPFIWCDYYEDNIGLFTNDPDNSYKLTLNGDALAYGIWQGSDISLKQNVKTIESSLERLRAIRGVTYEYSEEYNDLVRSDEIENQNITYIDSLGIEKSNLSVEKSNLLPITKYGVIAQELLEQFPDLVHKGSNGYYAVNYDGLIPVLIEAIKEQQILIDNIQNELKEINQGSLKSLTSSIENENEKKVPFLYQNAPNPFNETTTIKFDIPELEKSATINVYDLNGKQLRSYPIYKEGLNSITVDASTFSAGIYIYILIVDGSVIGTKQMVLTE